VAVTVYPNAEISQFFIRGMSKDGNAKRFPLPLGEGQGSPERAEFIFSLQTSKQVLVAFPEKRGAETAARTKTGTWRDPITYK